MQVRMIVGTYPNDRVLLVPADRELKDVSERAREWIGAALEAPAFDLVSGAATPITDVPLVLATLAAHGYCLLERRLTGRGASRRVTMAVVR